ncbi:hypothetical protein T11_12240 [Trichinella zimbabwensis]|uniref:Uncharacterized protein n=1 Tax=Trichinella zimbabwensis TaxID=268475 RepID=A0A0V1E3S4_9BILA|nr:hypothetical protein T11_12240 [Trichinella zimbabwensis]
MKELEKGPKKLKGVYMVGLMAPVAYVEEDGLVGNQWEERP